MAPPAEGCIRVVGETPQRCEVSVEDVCDSVEHESVVTLRAEDAPFPQALPPIGMVRV